MKEDMVGRDRRDGPVLRRCPAAVALAVLLVVAGCGGGPFDIVPVGGKIVVPGSGKLDQADRVVIRFVPQDVKASGKDTAPPATGDVNPADGTFSALTTRQNGDGAVVGRHKVVLVALKMRGGVEDRIDVIPQRYADESTTPLEADVPPGGKTDFVFPIE